MLVAGLLFHRGVLMSGSALSPWALIRGAANYATQVATNLNCSVSNGTSLSTRLLSFFSPLLTLSLSLSLSRLSAAMLHISCTNRGTCFNHDPYPHYTTWQAFGTTKKHLQSHKNHREFPQSQAVAQGTGGHIPALPIMYSTTHKPHVSAFLNNMRAFMT